MDDYRDNPAFLFWAGIIGVLGAVTAGSIALVRGVDNLTEGAAEGTEDAIREGGKGVKTGALMLGVGVAGVLLVWAADRFGD